MDAPTVLVSAVVGAITSAITAYLTSKLKVSEEREKWARELSQKYAEALEVNPGFAANLAKQFAIALIIVNDASLDNPEEGRGKIFVPPNSRLIVGRSPECDICIHDTMLSRRHAAFFADKAHIFIETMGAQAGVSVNGEPVDGRVRLRTRDVVSMGHARFEILSLSE
jgi:pSer/pThr/pTyr-binding forkhead associated (FHA) protein